MFAEEVAKLHKTLICFDYRSFVEGICFLSDMSSSVINQVRNKDESEKWIENSKASTASCWWPVLLDCQVKEGLLPLYTCTDSLSALWKTFLLFWPWPVVTGRTFTDPTKTEQFSRSKTCWKVLRQNRQRRCIYFGSLVIIVCSRLFRFPVQQPSNLFKWNNDIKLFPGTEYFFLDSI